MSQHFKSVVQQLIDFANNCGPINSRGCMLWRGGTNNYGYGIAAWHGNTRHQKLASRVSWEIEHGQPPPDDLWVLHKCDTPLCVNPDHLYLGTPAENSRDAVERGRWCRGERHPDTKITEKQVGEIRQLYSQGIKQAYIAHTYGIHQATVSRIVRYQRRRLP